MLDTTQVALPLTPLMLVGATSPILFPVAERKLLWLTLAGEGMSLDSHKAIVRQRAGTPIVLSVVRRTYKVVPNVDLYTTVEKAMQQEIDPDHLFNVTIKDKVSHYGRECFRDYTFNDIKCDIGAKSPINFRMVVRNSYGGTSISLLAGAIEGWCSNGLVWGEHDAKYMRHTSDLVIEGIDGHIRSALLKFTSETERWKEWTSKPVVHSEAMELLHKIASSPRMLDNLSDQYTQEINDRGNNLWALYSALTYYSSHDEGRFATKQTKNDSAVSTMHSRELDVLSWIKTDEWKALEEA